MAQTFKLHRFYNDKIKSQANWIFISGKQITRFRDFSVVCLLHTGINSLRRATRTKRNTLKYFTGARRISNFSVARVFFCRERKKLARKL